MKRLIVAALVAAGPAFGASMIAKNGESWLRLHDTPCKNEVVLSILKDEWKDKFRAAQAQVNGQGFEACWIAQDEMVFVIYDDGDRAIIPMGSFKPDGV